MAEARYFLGLLVVVCIPPAVLWWLLVHALVRFWRRLGAAVALTAVAVAALATAAALWLNRAWLMGRDLGTQWSLVGLSVVIFVPAVVLAVSRRRYLTVRIMTGVPEVQGKQADQTLLTEGPYAMIRHPRYVEIMLGTLACALFANWTGPYVVATLGAMALHVVVLLEERELADRFGAAYKSYKLRVPRYLPRRAKD